MTALDWTKDRRRQQTAEACREAKLSESERQWATIAHLEQVRPARLVRRYRSQHGYFHWLCIWLEAGNELSPDDVAKVYKICAENGWPIRGARA